MRFLAVESLILFLYHCDALGWWEYRPENSHYYYFFNSESVSWDSAKSACEARGGYLATISDDLENSFIYGVINDAVNVETFNYFMGLYRDGLNHNPAHETWKWIESNEASDYFKWNSHHPWGGTAYTRVSITDEDGEWRSTTSSSTKRYICEVNDACFDISVTCANGDMCVTSVSNTHACICDSEGFTGPACTPDAAPCDASPCVHGTCSNNSPGYTCDCSETGYTGSRCQTDINECEQSQQPCGRGLCVDLINEFECDCSNTGFTGLRCETEINECNLNPNICGPGVCMDLISGLGCDCTNTGFEGTTCNIEINECLLETSPCSNHGTCTDGINRYDCTCNAFYTGDHCETDINECDTDGYCNQGTCDNVIGGFNCYCDYGYRGDRCDQDIDECSVIPDICHNSATCDNIEGGYICICPAEWQGQHCSMPVAVCLSDPCLNDGNCTDNLSGYTCDCTEYYDGTNCEMDVNECLVESCDANDNCNDTHYDICNGHGNCTNTVGGYDCLCDKDYHGDRCQDYQSLSNQSTFKPNKNKQGTGSEGLPQSTIIAVSVSLPLLVLCIVVIAALLIWIKRGRDKKDDTYEQPKRRESTELKNVYATVTSSESPYEI